MTEDRKLGKLLRLRAERIAKVHFEELYATDNSDVVKGQLADGTYVEIDLRAKKIINASKSYNKALAAQVDATLITDEGAQLTAETVDKRDAGNYQSVIRRDALPDTAPAVTSKKATGKKVSKSSANPKPSKAKSVKASKK